MEVEIKCQADQFQWILISWFVNMSRINKSNCANVVLKF